MTATSKRSVQLAGVAILLSLLAATPGRGEGADTGAFITLKFAGGSARDYVDAVRRAAGELNVVVAREAAEVHMPAVSLTQVTPSAALDLLGGRVYIRAGRKVLLDVKHMPLYDPGEQPTYQIVARVTGRSSTTQTHVWTLAALVDNDIPSAAVLSAVEMALDVVGSETKLDVRFHEDTGLLIATGDDAQLHAIDEVIDRLQDIVEGRRENPMRHLEADLREADTRHMELVNRLSAAEAVANQARGDFAAVQFEIQRLEMQASELRRMLDHKDNELQQLRSLLTELELREAFRGQQRQQPNP